MKITDKKQLNINGEIPNVLGKKIKIYQIEEFKELNFNDLIKKIQEKKLESEEKNVKREQF